MAPRIVIRVAKKVFRMLTAQKVPHALAGGLAVELHGFNRVTMNVDFVVPRSCQRILGEQFGLSTPIRGHLAGICVQSNAVPIHLLFVAKPRRRGDLSFAPQHVGLPFIGVDALIAMKVCAGRLKDMVDIVELLEVGNSYDARACSITSTLLSGGACDGTLR